VLANCALGVYGGCDGIDRAVKGNKEAIALHVDLVTAVRRKCSPQEPMMGGQQVRVLFADLSQQAG
jgi:hypothetical protein